MILIRILVLVICCLFLSLGVDGAPSYPRPLNWFPPFLPNVNSVMEKSSSDHYDNKVGDRPIIVANNIFDLSADEIGKLLKSVRSENIGNKPIEERLVENLDLPRPLNWFPHPFMPAGVNSVMEKILSDIDNKVGDNRPPAGAYVVENNFFNLSTDDFNELRKLVTGNGESGQK